MADTTAQKNAERWIVGHFLPARFDGLLFQEQKVPLVWGGVFAFDAVSEDRSIIGLVSTSAAITAGNNLATAKVQKLKCDTLYLTNVACSCKKLLVFSEASMSRHFKKEADAGRFPKDIELIHAELPEGLQSEVVAARTVARREVTPNAL